MKPEMDALRVSDIVAGTLSVAVFGAISIGYVSMYRSWTESERSAAIGNLLATNSDSAAYRATLSPACSELVTQLLRHTTDWREVADRVSDSGICGAGSDAIVTRMYEYNQQTKQLEQKITDTTNELNAGWVPEIMSGLFFGIIPAKATSFVAETLVFAAAESINGKRRARNERERIRQENEEQERKEKERIHAEEEENRRQQEEIALRQKRAAQTWHQPEEAKDPWEPKISDKDKPKAKDV